MAKVKDIQNTPVETVIYCGPTLPRAKLVSMSVFKNGLPEYVQRQIEACPEIDKLIVPISSLAETRTLIGVRGTEENRLYQAISSARGGEA